MGTGDESHGAAILIVLLCMYRGDCRRKVHLIPMNPGDPWEIGNEDNDEGFQDEQDLEDLTNKKRTL